MSTLNHPVPESGVSRTRSLQRTIWVVAGALLFSIMLFLGYYVWDRYVHLGDQSPAQRGIAHMEEAIRQEPQNIEMRLAMADYYLSAERYREALEQAKQILELQPDQPGALLIDGIAHVRLGEPEASLATLQRFVILRKNSPVAGTDAALETADYFLGESHIRLGKPAEAIPILEAALAINPTDADVLYQLGLAYETTGQPEEAMEYYQKAVRLVPIFAEAYDAMASCYAELNQVNESAYARGMAVFSRGDYAAAQTDLESVTAALPGFAPLYLGLGLVYEQVGRLKPALEAVQRAIELDPRDLAAQQALGRIEATLGTNQ
jgi:tetratricopeptide (TPR) repeat protein